MSHHGADIHEAVQSGTWYWSGEIAGLTAAVLAPDLDRAVFNSLTVARVSPRCSSFPARRCGS